MTPPPLKAHDMSRPDSALLHDAPRNVPHVLLADPDLERAESIARGLRELGWTCEIAPGIWEALGMLDSKRFSHLVAQLRQLGSEDLGGMLLAWTWLRTGRRAPLVLGDAPEINEDPSVLARRVILASENSCATDIWRWITESKQSTPE